jgi:hypothetical protein
LLPTPVILPAIVAKLAYFVWRLLSWRRLEALALSKDFSLSHVFGVDYVGSYDVSYDLAGLPSKRENILQAGSTVCEFSLSTNDVDWCHPFVILQNP